MDLTYVMDLTYKYTCENIRCDTRRGALDLGEILVYTLTSMIEGGLQILDS